MKLLSLLFGAAAALVVSGHSHDHSAPGHSHDHGEAEQAGHSDVVTLNGDDFKSKIGSWDVALIEFYAPWCGHCKRLVPEYEQAAKELFGRVPLAKMDCTTDENKDVCAEYGVRGYPTLKVFHNDGSEPIPYEGARTGEAIVKFMKKQTEPAFRVLKTADDINSMIVDELSVIGFFAAASGAEYDAFVASAKKLRSEHSFGVVTDSTEKLAKEHNVKAPAVKVFKDFDDKTAVMTSKISPENVEAFINEEAFALLGEIGPENYSKYMDRKLPLGWFFLDYSSANLAAQEAQIRKVAAEFKGKFSFVKLDGVRWAEHAKTFGVTENPGLCIQNTETKKMFKLQDGAFDEASIRAHVQGVHEGKIANTVKSQEIPAKNDGPVRVLVGKSFESIVYDKTKDVFVEFYAPWCGHCKALTPKFDQLGTEMKKFPHVIIAKIDSTENDSPEDISGFPTLKFYPARDSKQAIDFSGDRTVDGMREFIMANALTIRKSEGGTKHDEL